MVAGLAVLLAIALVLVFAPAAGAGLVRLPPPPGQGPESGSQEEPTCDPDASVDTPSDCTAITPRNDRAVIFDSYTTTVGRNYWSKIRGEPAAVKAALESEHYTVTEDEGPHLWRHPLLSKFVAIAKQAPGVIYINSHGYAPGSASRDCLAAKGLIRTLGEHNPAERLPPRDQIVCHRDQAGLAVEPEHNAAELEREYAHYLQSGYSNEWIEPISGHYDNGLEWAYLLITTAGIEHFFGDLHTALVIDSACHSMAFDDAFDADSYVGYTAVACDHENEVDIPKFLDRLTGKSGVPARTTTGAFELGGFVSPVIDLAYVRPVVLSPAVESVAPVAGSTLDPGSSNVVTVAFDAAMKSANTTGVISASGCGATVSDEEWNENATELNFDVNIPQNTTGGTLTLTVNHTQAVADPGGFPNQQLDGNQSPAAASGEAKNESDYSWQLSCAPSSTFTLSGDVNTTLTLDQATCLNYPYSLDPLELDMTPTGAAATPPGEDSSLTLVLAGNGTTTFPSDTGAVDFSYLPNGSLPDAYNWGQGLTPGSDTETTGTVTVQNDGQSGSVDLTIPVLLDFKQGQATSSETIQGSWSCTPP